MTSGVAALPTAGTHSAESVSASGPTSLPIGVAAGAVADTIAPWADYAASGYHKLSAESQIFGPAAYDPVTGDLWIAESNPTLYEDPSLMFKVNASTLAVDGIISGVTNSSGVAYDPANSDMYISDPGTNSVLVLSAASATPVGSPIPVGPLPGNLSFNPSLSLMYVYNAGNESVAAINTTDNAVVAWSGSLGPGFGGVAYDAVTQNVAVALLRGLDWLNAETLYNRSFVPLSGDPSSVAIDQSGNADVGSVGGDAIFVNFTHALTGYLGLAGSNADGAAFDPVSDTVYFTDRSTNNLTAVSTVTQARTANVMVGAGPTGAILIPGTHQVDVLSSTMLYPMFDNLVWPSPPVPLGRTVSAVDGLTMVVNGSSRNLAGSPTTITYDPDGNQVVIGDLWDNNLTFVPASDPTGAATQVFVNGSAGQPAYDPATHSLWVPMQTEIKGCGGAWASDDVLLVLNASTGAYETTIYPYNGTCAGSRSPADVEQVIYDPSSRNMLVLVFIQDEPYVSVEWYGAANSTFAYGPVATGWAYGSYVTGVAPAATLDASQHELFVTSPGTDQVFIVNTLLHNVSATVGVGSDPVGIAYDAADGDAYVANEDSANLTVLNATTDKVALSGVALWGYPLYIGYDPSTQLIYVGVESGVGPMPANYETTLVILNGSSLSAVWGEWPTIYVGYAQVFSGEAISFIPSSDPSQPGQMWNSNVFDGTVTVISVPPNLQLLAPRSLTIVQGEPLHLTWAVSGGTDGITYTYAGLPPGCTAPAGPVLACTPTTTGTYTVTLSVVDGLGLTASSSIALTIVAAISVSATATPASVDLGATVWANATASGGIGALNYTWSWGDGSRSWTAASSHVYEAAGVYSLLLTVTDVQGDQASWSSAVTVTSVAPLSVALTLGANQTTPGVSVELIASTSGGVGPYTFAWALNGTASSGTGMTLSTTPAGAGNYTWTVTVTDAQGHSAEAKTTLEVLPVPVVKVPGPVKYSNTTVTKDVYHNGTASVSLGALAPYAGVGALVGLLLGLILGAFVFRRRKEEAKPGHAPGTTESTPSGSSAPAPSASTPAPDGGTGTSTSETAPPKP